MVGAVQSTQSSTATMPGSPDKTADFAGGDFETFLKMLTTQIRNQDPMNPMESTDFAVQLATFSGVEQQVRANTLLAAIANDRNGGGIGDYASWIGREVRSHSAAWFDATPLMIEVAPDPAADTVRLVVSDAAGKVVTREDIGTGSGTIEWSGRDDMGDHLASGRYSFTVESWKGGELLARDAAETYSQVIAVENGPDGVELALAGGGYARAAEVSGLRERNPAGPAR